MSGRYAKDTTVSVEKSKAEIEKLVIRYGATGFSSSWQENSARLEFIIGGRHVRLTMILPDKHDVEFTSTETGRERDSGAAYKAWEKACRSIWRSLKLIIQAKLEAVENGISTYDREFLADILLPDGETIAKHVLPKIEDVYEGGRVKALLPGF